MSKVPMDADNDGFDEEVDCDDGHAVVNPDAPEVCDGLDNDCDSVVDEDPDDGRTFYTDADGDGAGDPDAPVVACEAPADAVTTDDDCDDAEARAFPGNAEVCDEVDNDCDTAIDEDDASDTTTWYADTDGDSYGDAAIAVTGCAAPEGYVADGTDCDDAVATIHPDAAETDCGDATDYNCDGSVAYVDADGDGVPACEDCDDTDAGRSPARSEVCDDADRDEDCSGAADDADAGVDPGTTTTWYNDADADTYGDATTSVSLCDAASGYVADSADCDDAAAGVNPAAAEICDPDDVDEDCDGLSDDADPSVAPGASSWYADADGDGYGSGVARTTCDAPSGSVANADDCDDATAARNPGEVEICDPDDVDEDCDGLADDADSSATGKPSWYADVDGDGYGAGGVVAACSGTGRVASGGDCDDTAPAVNPGEIETCVTAEDDDCDGATDAEGATGCTYWFVDADADGYGGGASTCRCVAPSGADADAGDCDDSDEGVFPGATDDCDDGIDADCDGADGTCRSGLYPQTDADGFWMGETRTSGRALPVANVGDVDGDGDHDLVVGDAQGTTTVRNAGEAFFVPGGAGIDNGGSGDLADEASFEGRGSNVHLGTAVGPAGDLDADGYDDFLIGNERSAELVYGRSTPFAGDVAISTVASARLIGVGSSSFVGSDLGRHPVDLDGDGWLDLALPDWLGSGGFGRVYLHYGDGSRLTGEVSLSSAAYITGTTASSSLGENNSLDAGDIDGDGIDDLLVGQYQRRGSTPSTAGWAYLFHGETSRFTGETPVDAADCSWAGGESDYLGYSLAMLPDLDGDGYQDYTLTALGEDSGGIESGAVYVWGGGVTRCAGAISVTTADLTFLGTEAYAQLGRHITGLDDMDGDGLPDLAITTARYTDPEIADQRGSVYVYSGPFELAGTLGADDASYGWESDESGNVYEVIWGGDYDGDGLTDIATPRILISGSGDGVLVFLGGGE